MTDEYRPPHQALANSSDAKVVVEEDCPYCHGKGAVRRSGDCTFCDSSGKEYRIEFLARVVEVLDV